MRRILQSAAMLLCLLPAMGCDPSSPKVTPPTEGEKQEMEEAEGQMAKEIQKANARRRP